MSLDNSKKFKRVVEIEIEVLKKRNEINGEISQNSKKSLNVRQQNWVLEEISEIFDKNNKLKEKYVIRTAGNHFYRYGLTLYPFAGEERDLINNPLLILI